MMKKLLLALIVILNLSIVKSSCSQIIWEEIILPDSAKPRMIAFDSLGAQYIATNNGVYKSDNGYQWKLTNLTDYVSYIYINNANQGLRS